MTTLHPIPVISIGDDIDLMVKEGIAEAIAPRNPFPVYVASTIFHIGMWKDLRRKWRPQGVQITSTWIDKIDPVHGDSNVTPLAFAGHWIENYREITAAKAVLIYATGKDLLRGALIEAGIAMGQHKAVICVGDIDHPGWSSWQYHPLVHFAHTPDAALQVLRVWSGREPLS